MDAFSIAIMPLGILGFIFGMSALSEVSELKKKIVTIEKEIEELKDKE